LKFSLINQFTINYFFLIYRISDISKTEDGDCKIFNESLFNLNENWLVFITYKTNYRKESMEITLKSAIIFIIKVVIIAKCMLQTVINEH